VIVIDYLAWVTLGDDSFNPACWPDVPGMAAELAALNVTTVVSFYPYFNGGSQNYHQFVDGGMVAVNARTGLRTGYSGCLGGDTVYDPFNASARAALFGVFTRNYPAGWWFWHDCDEPGRDLRQNGQWRFSAGLDVEVGAAWPREHARMAAEGFYARGLSGSDFVTLSRAFYPGSARYSAALWSGDIAPTWASFYQQVRIAQTVAMSGVVLWASDTGGYLQTANTSDPAWRELLVRWTQFSALTPLFRWHGKRLGGEPPDACGPTNGPNEPWAFGDAVLAALRPMFALREGLRGYVEAASVEAAATGMPMLRPLALQFPDDPRAGSRGAEAGFMLGGDYLARPVTELGAREAWVYLPALPRGGAWQYVFNASLRFAGGQNVSVAAPLDEFPLFKRTG
jgi:alpha-D-xyloside xylohydrolase